VARYGGYVGVRKSHIDRAHAFFERNGAKTILFGRFIAVLRTWAAVVAGAAFMSFTKFVLYTSIGSIAWAIVFGALGYFFGRDLPLLEKYISRASLGVLILGAVAVGVFLIIQRRRSKAESPLGVDPPTTIENHGDLS
jgi:membrane-associated protein